MENGRIVRLMTKLGFINERAEYVNFPFPPTTPPPPPKHYSCFVETNRPWVRFELDPRWSDTGDRYILKLFRDYVFHSVGVDGKPILDLSHVLVCLNKVRLGVFCSSKQSLIFTSYGLNSRRGQERNILTFSNHSWMPVWTKGLCSSQGMTKVVLSLAIERLSIVLRLLSSEFHIVNFNSGIIHSSTFCIFFFLHSSAS